MVRRSTLFFAILSAQASRGFASRLTPTEADLHAAESNSAVHVTAVKGLQSDTTAVGNEVSINVARHNFSGGVAVTRSHLDAVESISAEHVTAVKGNQSDITAVGNEVGIDAARHNFSGGVAVTRSHVSLAGKLWKDTALAVGLFLLGVMLASLCFVCCIKDRRLSDECRSTHTVKARASSEDLGPSSRWEVWSPGNNEKLGPPGIESSFEGKAPLLDSTQWDSVSAVTGALNCKLLTIEEGYCIVWSSRSQSYYLIWRDGRTSQAYGALNMDVPRKVRFERTASSVSSDDDVDVARRVAVSKTASWASSVNAMDGENVSIDCRETFASAPQDNAALYGSLRQLSERIQGPVTKFPSCVKNAFAYGRTSLYIVVEPSSDADSGSQWRRAQINFFLSVDDFEERSDPQISVPVCDIVNVSWYHPSGSDPQIVLSHNQQAASFESRSDDSSSLQHIYLIRETRNETENLHEALRALSTAVECALGVS